MKIAVLGTGTVGATIGSKLIQLGHEVKMGSRTVDNEKALAWVQKSGQLASQGTFAEAAAFGECLFNCTAGMATIEALKLAGENNIGSKIIIDVSNPLDFSKGMPPSLTVCNTASLAEDVQNIFPKARVVKALNTMWCGLMVNPDMLNGGDHNTFVCGNDSLAKDAVKEILMSFGWKKQNIMDLGDLTAARGTEMYLPLWLRIYGSTKNGSFNIKIIS